MYIAQLRGLLTQLRSGELSVDEVTAELESLPFADLGFARLDHHRALRQGIPEVVFGQGKTSHQIHAITHELAGRGQPVLLTRLDPEVAASLKENHSELRHNPVARTAWIPGNVPEHRASARVAVVTAGTSDLPVSEEAIETLLASGVRAHFLSDVGVAGIHRLLPEVERLRTYQCVI
ncbi:MAG: hypothetical protein RJA70_4232, partial [Pseudomonadota bacterium]